MRPKKLDKNKMVYKIKLIPKKIVQNQFGQKNNYNLFYKNKLSHEKLGKKNQTNKIWAKKFGPKKLNSNKLYKKIIRLNKLRSKKNCGQIKQGKKNSANKKFSQLFPLLQQNLQFPKFFLTI